MEDYVHRVGRTGRAGYKGTAITLVRSRQYKSTCRELKKLLIECNQEIPAWFEKVCENAIATNRQDNLDRRFNGGYRRSSNNNGRSYNKFGNNDTRFESNEMRSRDKQSHHYNLYNQENHHGNNSYSRDKRSSNRKNEYNDLDNML